jgi:hypothetical protein
VEQVSNLLYKGEISQLFRRPQDHEHFSKMLKIAAPKSNFQFAFFNLQFPHPIDALPSP